MSSRQEFVLRAKASELPFAELCREFGISRKTGYKWLKRFDDKGTAGLVDESRRPRSNSLAIKPEIVVELVRLKQKRRSWGPKKLWTLLGRTVPAVDMPSVATIGRILDSAGLVVRRRRYRQSSMGLPRRPSVVVEAANDLWTADFKGWWRTGDGAKCEPLTVRDAHSRFVLELRIMRRTSAKRVRAVFEELFDRYGLPKAIQTDNGPPFASTRSLGGLTALSAWWVSLGIEVVRSRPGKPTDNGAHERMHGDIRVDIQDDAARTLRSQQLVCDEWRTEFNHVRPHEALGMKTPAEVYRPSSRRRSAVVVGGYPDCCTLLTVSKSGTVRWASVHTVYVSLALRLQSVGLDQRDDGFVYVWYFDRLLGRFKPGVDSSAMPIVENGTSGAVPSSNAGVQAPR